MQIYEAEVSLAALRQMLHENSRLAERFAELQAAKAAELSEHNVRQLRNIDDIVERVRRP